VRTGLHFDGVLSAKSFGLRRDNPLAVVELLAMQFIPGAEGGGTIELLFAGGGVIRLEVECIDASLRDISGPWPAMGRPTHETTGIDE
jgi:hypothetical protein